MTLAVVAPGVKHSVRREAQDVLLAGLQTPHLVAEEVHNWLRLKRVPKTILQLVSYSGFSALVLTVESTCSFAVSFVSRIPKFTVFNGAPAVTKSTR